MSALRPTTKKLTGPEKAAVLFLCLGEQRGSALMQKLEEEDIQKLTRAMSGLGSVPAEVADEVMEQFTDNLSNGGGVVGSMSMAEKMLRKFLPDEEVASIIERAQGAQQERDLWARFGALNETVIANYLKAEHAQTSAAILSRVTPDVAARVLPLLGEELMQEVVERMIRIEAVPSHVMRQIEETLRADIMASGSQPTANELQQRMANLFNRLDQDSFGKLSQSLEASMPDTFQKIKQKMFVFGDLIKLDAQALAQVMRNVPGNTLPLALRGASKELRDAFLDALPARSRDMLVEEMASMGPVRGSEVRAAQTQMVDTARELAENEVIALPMGDEEDELIE